MLSERHIGRKSMVKHRFSTHDVAAEVGCLKQKFLGMRLANIYDINAKASPTQISLSVKSMNEANTLELSLNFERNFHAETL